MIGFNHALIKLSYFLLSINCALSLLVSFSPISRLLHSPTDGLVMLMSPPVGSNQGTMTRATTNLPTLKEYLENKKVDQELSTILSATARACLTISMELSSLPIQSHSTTIQGTNVQGEVQTPMDVIANNVCIDAIKGTVPVMASEEVEEVIPGELLNGKYQIAFDPLDGSSNLDVSVPTG